MVRWDARTDSNQAEIVDALRKAGRFVALTHRVGQGFVDIVVANKGRWYMGEVKRPGEGLNPREMEWHVKARKYAPTYIWYSVEEALRDTEGLP